MLKRSLTPLLLALLSAGAGPGSAQAQSLPDAGALRQQIEQGLERPLPGRTEPLRPAEPAPLRLPEGVTLTVQAFRFAGNTLLADAQLQPAVQGYLQRPLGFADLQRATQAIAAVYRQAGWIVRAYLPAQDVTDGIVTIQVVEAVFSGTRIEDPQPSRIRPARVLRYVDAQQAQGGLLNAAALDRALLLADDLPGVAVGGALEPGERDGETALALAVRDEPLLTGQVNLDNQGARSTGSARVALSASVNSPLGIGDQWRGDLLHTKGSTYGRLAYSLPVGADGWRLGVNAGWFDYRLVADEFAALHGRGDSRSTGVDASYPLLRSRLRNLYLSFAYDHKRFNNEANQAVQSNYRVHAGSISLAGNAYDNLLGGGATQALLAWHHGRVDHGTLDFGEDRTLAGSFNKVRYSVSRRQVLGTRLALHGNWSGQYASRHLDSSERFYLGGPHGVRAYPANEAGGSRGNLLNLELRWRATPTVTVSGFYDWGQVAKTQSGPHRQTLKGFGVALAWAAPYGVQLHAMLAWRHGDNPYPTLAGKDQDGSHRNPRAWLQASLPF